AHAELVPATATPHPGPCPAPRGSHPGGSRAATPARLPLRGSAEPNGAEGRVDPRLRSDAAPAGPPGRWARGGGPGPVAAPSGRGRTARGWTEPRPAPRSTDARPIPSVRP